LSEKSSHQRLELKRALGLFSCVMLVIGNMIGVGIFTTPGRIAKLLPSPGWVFLAWCLGALLAISGALAYAELGAAYPQAGGNYVFLRESYGRLWGFLYGWSAAFITQSGTIAILAVGFTKYVGIERAWKVQLCAVGLIVFFSALNYIGVRVGAGVVDAITSLKVAAILGFAAAGAFFGSGTSANFSPFWASDPQLSLTTGLAMALIPIMYTYSGWNATVYVGGEVVKPERTIPLSLILGVCLTASLYLLLNAIYIYALPVADMRGEVAIARKAAELMFSPTVAKGISFFIAVSVLGCLNATLLTAPRVPYAMAQRGDLFAAFGEVHPTYRTPHRAILLQMVWGSLLALWGGLDHKHFYRLLDDYVTVPSLLMNALTVSALFYLRRRKPDLPRPYRAWGYPVLPLVFIAVVLWMVANEAMHDWVAAISGIAMTAVGVPFFYFFKSRQVRTGN
jgi:basic amino acid/polyamine antiporter, APA family